MIEAFFFGPAGRQVFASYHLPPGGDGRALTLVCPPLFVEHTRTHAALRKLAVELSSRGQHVVRLDYSGTGDSFGNLADVSVSDWVEDIALALREARELSGAGSVRILAVRAGALLAGKAAAAQTDLERLVLWDPVADGAAYLASLLRVQAAVLERNFCLDRAERRAALQEHAGHRLSQRMIEEFEALGAGTYAALSRHRLHVVRTSSGEDIHVGDAAPVVPFDCAWGTDSEDVLVPGPVLERLIECLTLP